MAVDWMTIPSIALAKQCVPEDLCVPDIELVGSTKLSLQFDGKSCLSCLAELCKHFRIDQGMKDMDFWLDFVLNWHNPVGTDQLFLFPKTWWPSAPPDPAIHESGFRQGIRRCSIMLSVLRNQQSNVCRVLHEQGILVPYLERVVERCKGYSKSVCILSCFCFVNFLFVIVYVYENRLSQKVYQT